MSMNIFQDMFTFREKGIVGMFVDYDVKWSMTIFPDLFIFREKGIVGLHEDGKVETVSYEKPGNMILTQGAEV